MLRPPPHPSTSRRAAHRASARSREALAADVATRGALDPRDVDWDAVATEARALLRRQRMIVTPR